MGYRSAGNSQMMDLIKLRQIEIIDFQAKPQLPVCTIEFGEVVEQTAIDEYFEAKAQGQRLVSRWFRSRFRPRPIEHKLPANMSLAECGATFLANCEGTKTVLCLSNGENHQPNDRMSADDP